MPYTVTNPPDRLKGKGIPDKYIRMFVHVFNSVFDRTKSDESAWKAAYKVMGGALRKDGYTKSADGKWHKEDVSTTGEEERMEDVLLATSQQLKLVEEAEDGTLTYEGVALVDNVLSGNKRFYSAAFNDRCAEETNKFLESGGTVTIFSRHGKAMGAFGSLPTGLPIGKVPKLFREGNKIKYTGVIVPTTEGKDVMTLIRQKVMLGTSIRADDWEAVPREFEGDTVQDMVRAILAGIDFTDNPGISGAGVERILEEVPTWEDEEMEINWEEVTVEELLENAKPQLDEYAATMVEASLEQAATLQGRVDELEETVVKLTEQSESLVEKAEAHEAQVEDLALKLKLAEAAHIGKMAKMVYEELSGSVTEEEQIPAVLESAREKAMMLVLSGVGDGDAKGKTSFGEEDEEDDEDEEAEMTEEAKKVLALSA